MMKIAFELEGEAAEALVDAVVARMVADGLAVVGPERTAPYSIRELQEETGLSEFTVRGMIESGRFQRVKGTGRVLVTVASVRAWQAGK